MVMGINKRVEVLLAALGTIGQFPGVLFAFPYDTNRCSLVGRLSFAVRTSCHESCLALKFSSYEKTSCGRYCYYNNNYHQMYMIASQQIRPF